MNRTRIALFVPSLKVGGLENVFLALAQGLLDAGWGVDCVVMQGGGEFESRLPDAAHVVTLNRRAMSSVGPLVRYLRERRPTHLIAFSEPCNLAAIVARWRSRVPVKVIATVHGVFSQRIRHTDSRKEKVYPLLARWLYPYADRVVAVSHGVADDLADFVGLARDKIEVIYNPLPVAHIQQQSAAALDHRWFAVDQDRPPVILSVGRLAVEKDIATLIRAFARLHQQTEARLCIIGDGTQKAMLTELVRTLGIEDDVYFAGYDPNPLRYMRRADVFALSSIHEGFGVVIAEALACGCPVVSTDSSGPAEILDGGRYGRLVPVGDAEALAAAIRATLDETTDADALRARAAAFDAPQAVNAYDALLRRSGLNENR